MAEETLIMDDKMPLPLPPAKDIPSTFVASVKSWYALPSFAYLTRLIFFPGGPLERRSPPQAKRDY